MRLPFVTGLLLGGLITGSVQANGTEPPLLAQDAADHEPGQLLVKFRRGGQFSAKQAMMQPFGLATEVGPDLALLYLDTDLELESSMLSLSANPDIEYVQPNYRYHATALPSDPDLDQLWGMRNTGQTVAMASYPSNNPPVVSGYDIDAELAWDLHTDCRNVLVAVLDTGINYTHVDLQGNMWSGAARHGWDFVDGDDDPMPEGGLEDHGTHVAGTIAAVGDNGLGGAGVCWQAQIMALRVLGSTGSGNTAGIIQGIYWAIERGARILNMSLGGYGAFDPAFSAAIDAAAAADVLVVVAAGNEGLDNDNPVVNAWPCNFPQDNLICVAALDQGAQLASFSNMGRTSVDVGAPGTNIRSSWAGPYQASTDSAGWQLGPGWQWLPAQDCVSEALLVNPSFWCSGGGYANNLNSTAFRVFDFTGAQKVGVSMLLNFSLQNNRDFFELAYSNSGGNPFVSGQLLGRGTGSSGGFFLVQAEMPGCNLASCSLGVRLRSDASISGPGVAMARIELGSLQEGTDSHKVINGTSMATPMVTGIAALVLSYHPGLSALQLARAIRLGGEPLPALQGMTSSGRGANAMGALSYLQPPEGLRLGVQPAQ